VNRNNVERLLELRKPLFGHLNGSIVKFVFKNNVTMLVSSRLLLLDPSFKVAINSRRSQVSSTITYNKKKFELELHF
jgi:hypothetical protein